MAGVTMDITKLKEAERQIRTLTEHSPDLIARFDQECRFLYVNSVVEQITGISAREFLGKRVGELTWERIYPAVPEDLLALRGAIKKAFTGVTLETEVRVPLPGGQRILTVRLVPEYDDAGQVVTVLHVGRDITERHRTEQALRESQARLELANHATRIGAWEWDLRTNQVHFSAEWKRQLGCGEHEIPNRYEEWESRLHPEDRERVLATLRDYLAGQLSDYEVEFRLLHKDGTYRWIFTRGEVFRDPEGKPLRMFGGHLDITDRKLAEAALRANRDRLLQQESALIALTKDELLQGGDLVASLRRLTEASAKALGVARVSLWRYQPGQQAIRCVDLYERLYDRHSDGAELAAVDYPAYFRALAECDVIAADDAHQEPRTADFSARYLTPLGITSMLDVPICLKGALDGVLCHEHIGPPRQWTSDERTFAIAIANLVALVLEEWEREQAQEELRQSQHAYASLVNTVDGIVWELDVPTLRFTFVSQQAERLLGFPIEHWLQEPTFWRDHLHPDDRELAVNFCLRVTEEMRDDDFRYRMIAVDGRVVWLHDLVTVVVENGRPAKLRGIMVDITESKLAEEALRQRTAFFEAQVDSDLDGILVVDSEGKKILQNQRMSDLWKIPPEIADDPDDAKQIQFVASRTRNPRRFAEKVAHLYAHTNEVSRDEIELTDGMVLDRYSSPVRGRDGKYYGRIWTFRDITERKRDQERIREQAALLDHTQDAVLVLSRDRRLRYCNLSAERFYGLPADQLLDQDAARLLFAEHPERCVEICQTTLERRTWSGELRHTTELGARRVVLSRWTLIRNAANQPASFLIVNTDVTEQKRLEEQFLRAQRVESIGTLASGVAHDLNNILAPILMAAELLRPLARTPEDQEVLVMIDQSARRGSDIIKQLLTFGRGVEGERIVLQPRSLLKEMVKVIRETFPKNLTLEQQFPDNLWTIQADPTQIHQVLLNLCVNARDAMPGGGKLTIAAENLVADAAYAAMNPEARPGPYVVLLIGDTGVGIPREIMHKIFDPFFTTKELGKGTGLGLSTVLGIVKSHGGFLQANSRLGEGTQFKVYLPALVEAEELQPGAPTEPLPRGHGELILVVDDEEAIRGVAQRVLEAHDYRAVTASDGVEALVTFSRSREPFQAVVTDMLMPVMDGAALIRALRHQSPGVRIIAMSGFVEQEAATAQSGLGAATFLSKPFSAERLVRTLHKILN
jgi:PAS domain S-box-containing protein